MKTIVTLLTLTVASTAAFADKASPDPIAAFVAKNAPGAKKLKSFTGKLESPDVKIFPIKKGRCYVLALRLGTGATLDKAAVEMDWPDDGGQQQPVGFGADLVDSRGAVFKPDCASHSASVGVWVGVQTFDGIESHGKGAYTIDVFERTASKRELAAEAAARARYHDENLKERDAARAKVCRECDEPKADRQVCVERRGVSMSDCGW